MRIEPKPGWNMPLLEALMASEKAGGLIVDGADDTSVTTEDLQECRRIKYRMIPPDEAWITGLIKSTPRAASTGLVDPAGIAGLLMSVDPEMLANLEAVLLVGDIDSPEDVCAMIGADPEDYPECMDPDDPDGERPLGCAWIAHGALLLDLSAILRTAEEIAPAPGMARSEAMIGVYTTLAHEIRHLGLANPFLPDEEYPDALKDEDQVEKWAIAAYEDWRNGSHA